MKLFLASALAVAWVVSGTPGRARAPKLSSAIPTGITPGQAVDVTLTGEGLAQPTGLWTNLPGKVIFVAGGEGDKAANRATWRIELPADAPLGVYAVRLATEQGLSNVRLLVVDDLPTVLESGDNVSLDKAQPLALPVAVEGAVKGEGRQYYKIHAEAGQRLSVEVLSRRFGSPLDAQVRLLDAAGGELAYSDDDDATGSDSRFVHRFAAAGDYYLEVGDVRYFGSVDYRYRLRLGDFPLVTAPFPLGVQAGSVGRVEVTGTDVGDLPALEAHAPAELGAAADGLRLKAAYPGGQGSGVVALVAGRGLEQVEIEPNDGRETASPVEPVGAVSGRLATDHDRDWFRLAVKKGTRLKMLGRTRSLGIARDLLLRLFDPAGKQVAAGTATRTDDSQIDFVFPDDGTYTLSVEDLAGHGGPDHVYRVEFAPAASGFALATDAERYNVPRGGVFHVAVKVARDGYAGPIELAAIMPGVTLQQSGTEIPAGKSDGVLVVTMPDSLAPGTWQTFQLVGRAMIDNQPCEAQASSLTALRSALNGLANPPAALDGALMLGIGPVFPQFIQLEASEKIVTVPQLAGKATVRLKATRTEKFSGPITLVAEGLPAGFALAAADKAVIKEGETEAAVDISTPLAAAEGDYLVRLIGTGTQADQPGRAAVEVTLRVVKPLAPASPAPATPTETSPAKEAEK